MSVVHHSPKSRSEVAGLLAHIYRMRLFVSSQFNKQRRPARRQSNPFFRQLAPFLIGIGKVKLSKHSMQYALDSSSFIFDIIIGQLHSILKPIQMQ